MMAMQGEKCYKVKFYQLGTLRNFNGKSPVTNPLNFRCVSQAKYKLFLIKTKEMLRMFVITANLASPDQSNILDFNKALAYFASQ